MSSRLQVTGYRLQRERAVRAADGPTSQRDHGSEQPPASAPESAGGRDPFLRALLPVACVLWFIVLALGLAAIATASERTNAIDWEQERAAFIRDLAWLSFKEKDHTAALRLATAASNAPARPGREKADADLRESATSSIAALNDEAR